MTERDSQASGSGMSRRDVLAASAVSGGVLGLSGCLTGGGGSNENIVLGVPAAQSGAFSFNGENVIDGTKLAVKHFNEEGGLD